MKKVGEEKRMVCLRLEVRKEWSAGASPSWCGGGAVVVVCSASMSMGEGRRRERKEGRKEDRG